MRHTLTRFFVLIVSVALLLSMNATPRAAGAGTLPETPLQLTVEETLPMHTDFPEQPYNPASQAANQAENNPLAPLASLDTLKTIEGINFDENGALNGAYNIPPDPHGAVGPAHVVSIVNTSIEWHTKAGSQQQSVRLGKSTTDVGSFFDALDPLTGTFDPKVIYDQYNQRFVVITLEKTTSPSNTSRILVAISDDSDPNGTWYYQAIDALENIGGFDCWGDYPGFGIDGQAVYITLNMFRHAGNASCSSSRLWILAKSGLYAGGTSTVGKYNPFAGGGSTTTAQPAHMFGTVPGTTGTFLVSYSGLAGGGNVYIQVVRVDNPLTTPTFNVQQIPFGTTAAIDNTASAFPGAPQSGTADTVNTNDRRALNAVWRNNALYVAFSTLTPVADATDGGQVTAYWLKINTSNLAALTIADQGRVGGEDIASGTYTFFPSVAIDANGNMAIGFAASAPTIYPGAYYTGRLAGDAAGTVGASKVLAAGTDYYLRTFGSGRNRWGDYTAVSVDPANDHFFWVFNEYAMTRGTLFSAEDGRWATRWGAFAMEVPTVYVDDSWVGTITGADPDGAGPATGFGLDAFATLQNGIDNVSAGGTVNVAAGTYAENVTVGKNLTIIGPAAPGSAAASVSPAAGSPLSVSAGTVVVKGLNLSTPGTALSVSGGTLTAYANNITSYATAAAVSAGTLNASHNWWGEASRDPAASAPTGLDGTAWAARLGSAVSSWADGVNSASLGSAALSGGTGTAAIVSFGRAASAAAAPFGSGVAGQVDTSCSDYYDFFVSSGSTGSWTLNVPVDNNAGCNSNTLATNRLYLITAIAECTPAGNVQCWDPAAGATHSGQNLVLSAQTSAALGGTNIVAGNATGADPTVLGLQRVSGRSATLPWIFMFGIIFSMILGLGRMLILHKKIR